MYLSHLSLLHFKNHRELKLDLGAGINCFTGPNGVGKTNLLDAVHYLSLCKSYFHAVDMEHVLHDEEMFMVQGRMEMPEQTDELLCSVRKGQRKIFSRNKKEYPRLADHVGRYPVVVITPYDGQLVLDGSDVRRRSLDGLIAQFDKIYLEGLIRYNKAVTHRNKALKMMAERRSFSIEMLEPWDEQLIQHGEAVHARRKQFMEELIPLLQGHYAGISGGHEEVSLEYRSDLHEASLQELLEGSRDRDRISTHTTKGVHKDDLVFTIGGRPLKRAGSQGQQKTYLIAYKLAQYDLIAKRSGTKPILLLDDIFDKIDPQRMRHLLQLVGSDHFGQILITDTDAQRLSKALDGVASEVKHFNLAKPTSVEELQEPQKLERTVA